VVKSRGWVDRRAKAEARCDAGNSPVNLLFPFSPPAPHAETYYSVLIDTCI
jgi:hypothetical protein